MNVTNCAGEWSGEKIRGSFAEEEAFQQRKRWAEITSGNCGDKKCYSTLRDDKDLVVWKNLCVYRAGNSLVWAELIPRRTLWAPGHESLFVPPISCRQDSSLHDLPWVPKGRFEQLLIKGEAPKKAPEARFKGPEKLIKFRRRTTWDPAHTLILSATLPLNYCYTTPHQILQHWDTVFEAGAHCVPLCLAKQ